MSSSEAVIAGAACTAANRIYVQSGLYDAFAEGLRQRVAALKVGAGASPDTECGPRITRKAVNKIERLVADAVRRGASMLCGGFHDLPTGLKDVPHNAAMAAEEIFGPVALERPEAGRLRTNHETC